MEIQLVAVKISSSRGGYVVPWILRRIIYLIRK
jgi:hypothetical protein